MVYNQDINLDLNTCSPKLILGAKQYDNKSRSIIATILQDGVPIDIPSNATATYRIQKPNGTCVWNAAEVLTSENKIKILFSHEDLDCSGRNVIDILLSIGTYTLGTTNFILDVQKAPTIDDAQTDEESKSYLAALVDQANEIIEDAQAWAEGKRGSSELVQDGYAVEVDTSALSVTFDWNTFKQNMPHEQGKIVVYVFQYFNNGWSLVQQDSETKNTPVNMSTLGFTIVPLGSSIAIGEQIKLTAQYQDEAWENHAKYYAAVAASSAATFGSVITSINSNLDNKLDIPFYGAAQPTLPSIGDYWVDTGTQFVLVGEVVGSSNIYDDSIYTRHIHGSAITASEISNNTIQSRHLSAGAVTSNAIASHAIFGNQIAGAAISNYNIASNAVGSAAIQSNSIYNFHVANSAIDSRNIINAAIKSNHLSEGSVTSFAIASNAIENNALIDGIVTQNKISSNFINVGTIPAGEDLSPGILTLQSTGKASAIIFFVSTGGRGIIAYYNTNNNDTQYSGFINQVYPAENSAKLKLTTTNTGALKIYNSSSSGAITIPNTVPVSYMAIVLSGNISFTSEVSGGSIVIN